MRSLSGPGACGRSVIKPESKTPSGVLHPPAKVPEIKAQSRIPQARANFSRGTLSTKECRGAARARAHLQWLLLHRTSPRAAAAAVRPPSSMWSQPQSAAEQQQNRHAVCTASACALRCAASFASVHMAVPAAAPSCHTRLWCISGSAAIAMFAAVSSNILSATASSCAADDGRRRRPVNIPQIHQGLKKSCEFCGVVGGAPRAPGRARHCPLR